jgi:hypothetical protein
MRVELDDVQRVERLVKNLFFFWRGTRRAEQKNPGQPYIGRRRRMNPLPAPTLHNLRRTRHPLRQTSPQTDPLWVCPSAPSADLCQRSPQTHTLWVCPGAPLRLFRNWVLENISPRMPNRLSSSNSDRSVTFRQFTNRMSCFWLDRLVKSLRYGDIRRRPVGWRHAQGKNFSTAHILGPFEDRTHRAV